MAQYLPKSTQATVPRKMHDRLFVLQLTHLPFGKHPQKSEKSEIKNKLRLEQDGAGLPGPDESKSWRIQPA